MPGSAVAGQVVTSPDLVVVERAGVVPGSAVAGQVVISPDLVVVERAGVMPGSAVAGQVVVLLGEGDCPFCTRVFPT